MAHLPDNLGLNSGCIHAAFACCATLHSQSHQLMLAAPANLVVFQAVPNTSSCDIKPVIKQLGESLPA